MDINTSCKQRLSSSLSVFCNALHVIHSFCCYSSHCAVFVHPDHCIYTLTAPNTVSHTCAPASLCPQSMRITDTGFTGPKEDSWHFGLWYYRKSDRINFFFLLYFCFCKLSVVVVCCCFCSNFLWVIAPFLLFFLVSKATFQMLSFMVLTPLLGFVSRSCCYCSASTHTHTHTPASLPRWPSPPWQSAPTTCLLKG